jgi:hypothetical protein
MRKKLIIVILACSFLLLTIPGASILSQSETYSIEGMIIGVGGGERASANYVMQDAIGAPAIGGLQSENFSMEIGSPEYDPLNHPPVADAGGPYLVAAGGTIQLAGGGSDPDGDPLTYHVWTQDPVLGTFSYSQGYQNPTYTAGTSVGITTVTITVDDGILQDSARSMLVVYDPTAGFVTGGGWINSPSGAYAPEPSLSGKATFGFVSKYQKGATTPTGQTEFQFHVANMNFKSTSYNWLVVSGARAQYKGLGTINGTGNCAFILTAIDGQVKGGGGVDKFRIKIWDKVTGNAIYDNQMDAADTADPTTVIAGGSIVIHK